MEFYCYNCDRLCEVKCESIELPAQCLYGKHHIVKWSAIKQNVKAHTESLSVISCVECPKKATYVPAFYCKDRDGMCKWFDGYNDDKVMCKFIIED